MSNRQDASGLATSHCGCCYLWQRFCKATDLDML
jgi:hypothetical protein